MALFQIAQHVSILCPIRDGIIGATSRRFPMTYFSEALAHKLAGRLDQEDCDSGGDGGFYVVSTDGKRVPPVWPSVPFSDASIPF